MSLTLMESMTEGDMARIGGQVRAGCSQVLGGLCCDLSVECW